MKGYTYTDRPVYRPGDTVHFKTIVRAQTASGYTIPQGQELSLQMRDPQTYETIWTQTIKLSDMGTAYWNYAIPADAKLGSCYLSMQLGDSYVDGTNFAVEDYKKPEYSVKVTAQTPRVLQGQPIKATIDARYYFGEPVSNATVKWVVHTSPYWALGRSEDEDQAQDGGDEGGGGDENADNGGAVLAGVGAAVGPGAAAVSEPAGGLADWAVATDPVAASQAQPVDCGGPASGAGRGILAPWVATSSRIAMGITMAFMLLILI